MKKILGVLLVFIVLLGMVPSRFAQEAATERLTRLQNKTRKDLLSSGMSAYLGAKDYEVFLEVFAAYEKERQPLDEKGRTLVGQLVGQKQSLSDEQAYKFTLETLELQQASLALRQRTIKLIAQRLSGKAAARFAQLEDYLNTAVRWEFLEKIPLWGDVK